MTCREKIISEDYADILLDYVLPPDLLALTRVDYCYTRVEGDLGVAYIRISDVDDLSIQPLTYREIPAVFGLMANGDMPGGFDPSTLINSGILPVQGEPLQLTGKDVTIAFIDTGIDYRSPYFQNADGTTRITAIWDQTIHTGEPPEGFLYGTEYRKDLINVALGSSDPYSIVPSRDENGHGSSVASVAAGSRLDDGVTFNSAAPDSNILVVKLREAKQYLKDYYLIPEGEICYSESDIILALKYVMSFWTPFTRPLVICFALGSNMGDHAGNSVLSDYMNFLAGRKSVTLIVCGGNEGNGARHYQNTLPSVSGEAQDDVEIRVAEGETGFVMELWGNSPALFTIRIRTPGGESVAQETFRTEQTLSYRFIYERTVITLDYIFVEQGSGEQLIFFRFENPTPGIWTITVTNETGNIQAPFFMYLPIEQHLKTDTVFLRPNPYTTLTEPGYADRVITVSSYDDRNGSFSVNSGRGYSRLSDIKPDFAAPGIMVPTLKGKQSGSGFAAALTAGAVADFMQWAVIRGNAIQVDSNDIKSYFIRGATRDADNVYPNREFGFGTLNLQGIFDVLAR